MDNLTPQTQFENFEMEQTFNWGNFNAQPFSENLTNSYFSFGSYEEDMVCSVQELKDNNMEIRSIAMEQELDVQDFQNLNEYGHNNAGNKKTFAKWYEGFQIPPQQLCYNGLQRPQFAYQLQLSCVFEQNFQENISESKDIYAQKVEKQERIKIRKTERRMRVERYQQKKDRRSYIKKISYICRKTVADNRLRVKGRFINKKHALEIEKSENLIDMRLSSQYSQ